MSSAPPDRDGTPTVPPRRRWTPTRITTAIVGVVLVILSLAVLATGVAAAYLGTAGRDDGYVHLDSNAFHTEGYALVSTTLVSDEVGTTWDVALSMFGRARIQVTAGEGTGPIFVGIARPDQAATYLAGLDYTTARDLARLGITYTTHKGTAPADPPGQERFWTSQASGLGTQTVFAPARGDWMLVVMNADGSRPVGVRLDLAASLPGLAWVGAGLLLLGVIGLAGGVMLMVLPARRVRR